MEVKFAATAYSCGNFWDLHSVSKNIGLWISAMHVSNISCEII